MEIFNTVRSQQPKTAVTQPESIQQAQQNVTNVQKPADRSPQQIRQEGADKTETEKLKKELQDITDKLNKEMDPLKTSIRFGFDDKINELYISVIDTSNNQVIRKIPSEEAMRLAAKMRELVGMIFDKKG